MNTQTTNLVNQETKPLMVNTLASENQVITRKEFSAAELWFIQRQHKSINQRRRFA